MISSQIFFQLFRFGIVGGIATLIHYMVAVGVFYYFSVSEYLANLFGYLAAVAVSLVGQTFFTFRAQLNTRVFLRFIFVSIGTFLLSELLVFMLKNYTRLDFSWVMVVVVVFIPLVTFVLQKHWVYKRDK